MAIGRISGPLLRANLLRDEVDIAFETDLIYLDVNTHASDIASGLTGTGKVGIKTSSPLYDLDINGTSNATLVRGNQLQIDDVKIDLNTISSTLGALVLTTSTTNDKVEISRNTKISADLEVTGDITVGGNINVGNSDTDTIAITAELISNIVPNESNAYDLGTSGKAWRTIYVDTVASPDTNLSINTDVATITGTTQSTSTTTGALVVSGGVGISSNLYIGGNVNVSGSINFTSGITVPNGGTGRTSFTTNGVLFGNNTNALQVTAASTPGSNATTSYGILTTNDSNVPVWTDVIDCGTY